MEQSRHDDSVAAAHARIETALAGVRRRIQAIRMVHEAARWLGFASLAAIGLGVLRLATSGFPPPWTAWLVLAGGAVLGGLLSLRRRASFASAAARVDRHYGWKDTLTTAWHVSRQPRVSAWGREVLARANPLLSRIAAGHVAPWRFGRTPLKASAGVLLAVLLGLCPTLRLRTAAPPEPRLSGDAVVAVNAVVPRGELPPESVARSLRALAPPAAGGRATQGRLAVIQDHAIVRDYFRRQAAGQVSLNAAP